MDPAVATDGISPLRTTPAEALLGKLTARTATIGVIGLGYVGLPLARAVAEKGFKTLGFDIDAERVSLLASGRSPIPHITSASLERFVRDGSLAATTDFSRMAEADAIIICVPTPLTQHREPDLSFVVSTAETIAIHLRRGQLVVLESTTYPGTTSEVVRPILEASGLKSGADFYLAYSPEREDPGNEDFEITRTPKVVGGDGSDALCLAETLYGQFVSATVPVSSTSAAEAVKLTENIFRAVNIALVNELKIVFGEMDIDIWEVVDSAKTKPFGFMPFYPGPGLGGHCIPIDPFYLTWKAREYGISTRFIELAGEINTAMPKFVVSRVGEALNERLGKPLRNSRILLVGLAYKKNVGDIRESPALRIMELLERSGALVEYHDPFFAEIPMTREHEALAGRRSVLWTADTISGCDAAVICTDHDELDYSRLAENAALIVDTRNVMARAGLRGPHVVKA